MRLYQIQRFSYKIGTWVTDNHIHICYQTLGYKKRFYTELTIRTTNTGLLPKWWLTSVSQRQRLHIINMQSNYRQMGGKQLYTTLYNQKVLQYWQLITEANYYEHLLKWTSTQVHLPIQGLD